MGYASMTEQKTLIEIKGLRTYFHTEGGTVKAVEDLNISIKPGQTLGIVGESGSGKSVTSLSIMQLLPKLVSSIEPGSSISFFGQTFSSFRKKRCARFVEKKFPLIFQKL